MNAFHIHRISILLCETSLSQGSSLHWSDPYHNSNSGQQLTVDICIPMTFGMSLYRVGIWLACGTVDWQQERGHRERSERCQGLIFLSLFLVFCTILLHRTWRSHAYYPCFSSFVGMIFHGASHIALSLSLFIILHIYTSHSYSSFYRSMGPIFILVSLLLHVPRGGIWCIWKQIDAPWHVKCEFYVLQINL